MNQDKQEIRVGPRSKPINIKQGFISKPSLTYTLADKIDNWLEKNGNKQSQSKNS